MADSNKHKHLDYIQDVVNRLAGNSFAIKGWAVTIITALFALAASESVNSDIVWFAFIPILAFWLLDGYFLWQERLFRGVYKNVARKSEKEIDFIMNPQDYIGGVNTWFRSMLSSTLSVFYVALIGLTLLVGLYALPVLSNN